MIIIYTCLAGWFGGILFVLLCSKILQYIECKRQKEFAKKIKYEIQKFPKFKSSIYIVIDDIKNMHEMINKSLIFKVKLCKIMLYISGFVASLCFLIISIIKLI